MRENPFEWVVGRYPHLDQRARELTAQLSSNPDLEALQAMFTPTCLEKAPPLALATQLAGTWRKVGNPRWVEPINVIAENVGFFTVLTERHCRLRVGLQLEVSPPQRIASYQCFPLKLQKSFRGVTSALKELPGKSAVCVSRMDSQEIFGWRSEEPRALASGYKLFVLAALMRAIAEEGWHWEQLLHLGDEQRTIPSGNLNAWPSGAPLTLQSLATLMVSRSDNTATHMLMDHLGADRLEGILPVVGNRNPDLLTPMLSVADLMRFRRDPERARRYQEVGVEERRQMLRALRDQSGPWVLAARPLEVELGWQASPADMNRLLIWICQHSEEGPVREMLAVNPGIPLPLSRWSYVGYKGGGEPGVVSANWLLRDNDDHWYAVSGAWNRSDGQVDEKRFFNRMESLLYLLPDGKVAAPSGEPLGGPSTSFQSGAVD